MKRSPILLTLGTLLLGSGLAHADEVYRNSVRSGLYAVRYTAHADDVSGPFVPAGVNLDVKDVNTLYLAYVRRFSPRLDLELAFGLPPKTDTVGKGPTTLGSVPYDGQVISTVKWFAPTLLLEYKFLEESSRWRPFVGVGINYTRFLDRKSTAAGDAANGGPTAISLSASVGPAVTAGLSYHIRGRLNAYASYSYSQVRSDLTANTAGIIRRTRIDFKPKALVLSLGYSF